MTAKMEMVNMLIVEILLLVCGYVHADEDRRLLVVAPQRHNVCDLPRVTGPCRAAFQRWYFNRLTRRCEQFIYGGCQGNANNFQTEFQCRNRCGGQVNLPVCRQPQESGRCLAYFPRYWYNYLTRRCEQFIYGGCGGNQNNFQTITECYRRCGRGAGYPFRRG